MAGRKPTPGGRILRELVQQFPNAPALTLAKRACRDHPELWSSVESCRTTLRGILGVCGKRRREGMLPTHFRAPRKAGWSEVIPEAIYELENWKALQIDSPERALILSDVHIPFHDPKALEAALTHGEALKPTLIVLNGDCSDHFSISRFVSDPKMRDFAGEVKAQRHFLKGLRKRFPRARIIYKWGNHEERWDAYMRMKCPELLGIEAFDWENVFGLKENRIELVKDKRPIRLGKLNLLHGHEYTFNISNPVNPARGFFLRAKAHVLGGHMHQTSQHSEKNVEEKVVSAFSTGCLCNLHPAYRPLNPWNHGFAEVKTSKDGAFQVENYRIVDGKVW